MRDTLAALIERVEQATGPDVYLDHDICEAVEGRFAAPYTASRDAAASLMPPDHHVEVRGVNDQWHVACNSTWDHAPYMPPVFCGVARTEPLARLAAALRARMESER